MKALYESCLKMRLYLLSTSVNDRPKAFSRAVVAAETEEDAQRTHPDGRSAMTHEDDHLGSWVSLNSVQVHYLGEAKPGTQAGVILATYIRG
jgi:hypothetical protein